MVNRPGNIAGIPGLCSRFFFDNEFGEPLQYLPILQSNDTCHYQVLFSLRFAMICQLQAKVVASGQMTASVLPDRLPHMLA